MLIFMYLYIQTAGSDFVLPLKQGIPILSPPISVIPYLDDWIIHHSDLQVLLRHQSQLVNTLNMVGLKLNEAKPELEPVQDI